MFTCCQSKRNYENKSFKLLGNYLLHYNTFTIKDTIPDTCNICYQNFKQNEITCL